MICQGSCSIVSTSSHNANRRPFFVISDPPALERSPGTRGEDDGVYQRIRRDIVAGDLPAGRRLNVSELARRYGSSTNPVREALQQLRGEGFVQFSKNRGARVRPIDEDFLRNIYEITVLLEPYMLRAFVAEASDEDVAHLEAIQGEIEATGMDDPALYGRLDDEFHAVLNARHYNDLAVELWQHRREALRALTWSVPIPRARRVAIVREHRGLIECVRTHDADRAAEIVVQHIQGSAELMMKRLRRTRAGRTNAKDTLL